MKISWLPIILALGAFSSLSLRAQENDCARRWVPVNVVSHDGKILTGLQPSSFQGFFRGMPVKILSASWDEQPRRVLILLDSSGSMTKPETVRGLALNVADQVATQMPQTTQVGLAVFSKKINQTVNFSTDRQAFHKELMEMAADTNPSPKGQGVTALRDAIFGSLSLFGRSQEGDVLYVISDGGENASHIPSGRLKQAILDTRIRVFAMLAVDPDPRGTTMEETTGREELEDLVDSTGGFSVGFDRKSGKSYFPAADLFSDKSGKPTQLALDLSQQFRRIVGFYRLQVELPEPVDKPRQWDLKLADPKQLKSAVPVYPRTLTPCSASNPAVPKPE